MVEINIVGFHLIQFTSGNQGFYKQLEESMVEYERVSRQVLEDGTYRDPYHVEPIELTKKRQRKIFLVQHLLGWARYLF